MKTEWWCRANWSTRVDIGHLDPREILSTDCIELSVAPGALYAFIPRASDSTTLQGAQKIEPSHSSCLVYRQPFSFRSMRISFASARKRIPHPRARAGMRTESI